jgi:acetyltransferase-like isoleucine patch superfamily enzyme
METFRKLTQDEIESLERQMCSATDWNTIEVAQDFSPEHIKYARFSGRVRLGSFRKEFSLAGGMVKHSGIYYATLHNVTVGDDCCIENVKNYIANYTIGNGSFIENVDIILADGISTFGNGVEVSVLNETGGCEVMMYDHLSAQLAFMMAFYRHRPSLLSNLRRMIGQYVRSVQSSVGTIGKDVVIADAGYIKNVRIGDCCKIEGASKLKNGSINSNSEAPVHIGVGVIGDDFIISSGSNVEDGVTFSRCFIGQACRLGHNYSASDSLFFSNCQGENGEACAIFAGPFTVTHHKSTLLIAGMFSFMNAGSGSNQSNHLYKLGPIHHGVMERGSKTASDSYVLWPAKVGAFSLVMGRHVCHQDTSDLPFSYLIEQQSTSYIMPGANLKSVGTIRDAKKWPSRDRRKGPGKLDSINFNLLSPFTIQKMLRAVNILQELKRISGDTSDYYVYQSGRIKSSSLAKGLKYYGYAIDKFFGNSLITRIMNAEFSSLDELRKAFVPRSEYGNGEWVDLAGMIAPEKAVEDIISDIEEGKTSELDVLNSRISAIHNQYYHYEWRWASKAMEEYYGFRLADLSVSELSGLIHRWKDSVIALDKLLYEDAGKEFSLSGMPDFESDPFVRSVKEHMEVKSSLASQVLEKLSAI